MQSPLPNELLYFQVRTCKRSSHYLSPPPPGFLARYRFYPLLYHCHEEYCLSQIMNFPIAQILFKEALPMSHLNAFCSSLTEGKYSFLFVNSTPLLINSNIKPCNQQTCTLLRSIFKVLSFRQCLVVGHVTLVHGINVILATETADHFFMLHKFC